VGPPSVFVSLEDRIEWVQTVGFEVFEGIVLVAYEYEACADIQAAVSQEADFRGGFSVKGCGPKTAPFFA